MREIKISIETAQRWANGTDEELKGLALQTYPELAKKELPKSFDDFEKFKKGKPSGFFAYTKNTIVECISFSNSNCKAHPIVFATKEQAQASIALAQLSQLREVYRNGWMPDWTDHNEKHCIVFMENEFITEYYLSSNTFLSFQDAETRDLFLENFIELIEKAKPLIS
jgi:hypothetical protein